MRVQSKRIDAPLVGQLRLLKPRVREQRVEDANNPLAEIGNGLEPSCCLEHSVALPSTSAAGEGLEDTRSFDYLNIYRQTELTINRLNVMPILFGRLVVRFGVIGWCRIPHGRLLRVTSISGTAAVPRETPRSP